VGVFSWAVVSVADAGCRMQVPTARADGIGRADLCPAGLPTYPTYPTLREEKGAFPGARARSGV